MSKHRKQSSFGVLLDFVDVIDTTFVRLTGKKVTDWLAEFRKPRELPPGGEGATNPEPSMALADAYAVLGLAPTASPEEAKVRYRTLANLFHPDRPGGYTEAMVLLNNAYQRITVKKGEK